MGVLIYTILLLPFVFGIVVQCGIVVNSSQYSAYNVTNNYTTGQIYCGGLICPNGSVACQVTEFSSPYNQSVAVITRRCLDMYGNPTAITNSTFANQYGETFGFNQFRVFSREGIFAKNNPSSYIFWPNVEHKISHGLKQAGHDIKNGVDSSVNKIKNEIDKIKNLLDF